MAFINFTYGWRVQILFELSLRSVAQFNHLQAAQVCDSRELMLLLSIDQACGGIFHKRPPATSSRTWLGWLLDAYSACLDHMLFAHLLQTKTHKIKLCIKNQLDLLYYTCQNPVMLCFTAWIIFLKIWLQNWSCCKSHKVLSYCKNARGCKTTSLTETAWTSSLSQRSQRFYTFLFYHPL